MKKNFTFCTTVNVYPKDDDPFNVMMTLEDIREQRLASKDIMPDKALQIISEKKMSQEVLIERLKREGYRNIMQGTGNSRAEAKENWNQLYFIDYDISEWVAGEEGMHDCIAELQAVFPNYLIIKPSNRFGIHVVLSSEREIYNGPEHVFYGIKGYRIVKKYNPVFKKKLIYEQFMDGAFFNNFKQMMNLNILTFLGEKCYFTSDFAVYNSNPKPFPKTINGFDDYIDELNEDEKLIIKHYANKSFGSNNKNKTEKTTTRTIVRKGNAFNINKDFGIPGVPYTGNDLRWRIVAILYAKMGYEETKNIIPQKFVQAKEMLSALETINRSQSVKYDVKNYLIERFVDREVLEQAYSDADSIPIDMSEGEYLSNYLATIESALYQSSIYLVSPPNTGKTELMKMLFHRLDKCVIIVHQTSILASKYESDPKFSPYIIKTKDVKKMGPTPDKVICIWDTFENMARTMDFSTHYLLLDETHNLITQFGFRNVIIDVLQSLKSKHQLWMTGTPCGEEVLMPEHTRMDFHKQSQTQYNVCPIQVDTIKHKEYISYVCDLINRLLPECGPSSKKLIAIYDNHDHNIWQIKYGKDSAHYVSVYKNTADVAEINYTAKTSKAIVNSTSFLGEGVDVKGYDEVFAIIPVNYYVSELNILQFVKRFRDAKTVFIYLIQYKRPFDFQMPYNETDKQFLRGYIDSFKYKNARNPVNDRTLKVDHLEVRQLKLIATEKKYQNLYDAFFRYMSSPFNIYLAHYLQFNYSFNVLPITYQQPGETEIQVPSRENPILREYVSKNYERLAYMIDESDGYDDVIYQVEDELGNGEVTFRAELRNILTIIRKANEMHCLRDCVEYFTNKNGDIQWQKISRFWDDIQLQQDILDGKVTMDSDIKSCKSSGQQRMKSIERSVDILNFKLRKGVSIATQVDMYRESKISRMNAHELLFDYYDKGISVFKEKNTNRNRKNKSIVIKNRTTAESHSFDSHKDCMVFLNVTKPTLNKALSEGSTKLNREWDFIIDGCGLTRTDSSIYA